MGGGSRTGLFIAQGREGAQEFVYRLEDRGFWVKGNFVFGQFWVLLGDLGLSYIRVFIRYCGRVERISSIINRLVVFGKFFFILIFSVFFRDMRIVFVFRVEYDVETIQRGVDIQIRVFLVVFVVVFLSFGFLICEMGMQFQVRSYEFQVWIWYRGVLGT